MYDDAAEFPAANFNELREAGLLGCGVPTEYGGDGFWWDTFRDYYEIYERIAEVDSSTAQLYQIQAHGAGLLAFHSNPEQRAKYLPEVASKGLLIASVGSEADFKSKSVENFSAELTETPSGYRLTCHKYFASLGPGADYMLIWTALPGSGSWAERMVFVLVPTQAPEVELIDEWDVMGMRATVSWAVKITDYPVPADAIIGQPGAWKNDPRTFTLGYVTNHLGSAQGAFNEACDYVRDRAYLAKHPNIRVSIGELSSDLEAVRSMLYAAADLWTDAASSGWETGRTTKAELLSLQALHVSKKVALDVSRRVFDICGARAAFRSLPFDAIYRDIRTFTLHHRDFDYMDRVASEVLDGVDRLKADQSLVPVSSGEGEES